jgi:hypothetical protein
MNLGIILNAYTKEYGHPNSLKIRRTASDWVEKCPLLSNTMVLRDNSSG